MSVAIQCYSARQLSTLRPSISSPIARLQASKPTLSRSFYQSRIARAEEDKREAEELKDETTAAAEEAEQAAEVAQQAADDAVVEAAASEAPESEPAVQEAQEVAEGESSIAAEAVEKAAVAASTAFSTGPPEPPQPSAAPQFPNDQDTGASTGTNFAAPAPSRILYIGNLFFEVTAAQLESEFGKFGTITNSRVVTDARGLSKGFGYIEFAQQSAADQAVRELDQKVYQGRRMAVQYHVRRERRAGPGPGRSDKASNPPSKTLFIGNMSYQMSDRDLNDLFREIRDVLDVRVAIDRRSGQPRGFAHADFIDVNAAQRAKEHLEKKVVYGRQLRVDYSSSSASSQAGQV
ncbi:hypothetical protein LTR09_000773 [Extremus antarcticus]|uniref:RRM domain-containing protein n=1 Tax=Extremus antarcticus TaxID=702011 RepID=A0AAJ0GK93_9PEZI|nr:hypothetical protein LTR09_000773 [Extremus antarcticus]